MLAPCTAWSAADDVAGQEIGEGQRIDGDTCGVGVVGFVRVLVDVAAGVGDDDQPGVAALAQRQVDRRRFVGVGFAGGQRAKAGELADEHVVGC
jgi:hypothetical protein